MGVGCAAATASAIGASLDIAACVVKWEKWFQRRLEEVRGGGVRSSTSFGRTERRVTRRERRAFSALQSFHYRT